MIALKPMSQAEFEVYKRTFIADYAADAEKEYRMSHKEAQLFSEKTLTSHLALGLRTPGHFLLKLSDGQKDVGAVWYFLTADSLFVMDLSVYAPFRRRGYGTKILEELEKMAVQEHKKKIELYVFCSNRRAVNLYEKLKYQPVRLYMEKLLD